MQTRSTANVSVSRTTLLIFKRTSGEINYQPFKFVEPKGIDGFMYNTYMRDRSLNYLNSTKPLKHFNVMHFYCWEDMIEITRTS